MFGIQSPDRLTTRNLATNKPNNATDVHTFTNIYWSMLNYVNTSYIHGGFFYRVKSFSNDNKMNNKKLVELLRVVKDIEDIISERIGTRLTELPEDEDYPHLGTITARFFAQAYSMNKFKLNIVNSKVNYLSNDNINYTVKHQSTYSHMNFRNPNLTPKEIITGQTLEVQIKDKIIHSCGIIVSEEYF